MSLARASIWTAGSTLIKIGAGLLVVKLLALTYGPSGIGQAGNFRQLVTVLGVLSGAGIFNGVTKYIAEHHEDADKRRAILGTSSTIILLFSTLLAIIFLLFSAQISVLLFGHDSYHEVIVAVAFIQMGIGYANYFLAILKGYRDAAGNALAIVAGSLIGVAAYYLCLRLWGYGGALAGLALVPALIIFPALIIMLRRKRFPLSDLKPAWDRAIASHLGKFTLMALMTAVTLPVAYILMRNLLADRYSWDAVGLSLIHI